MNPWSTLFDFQASIMTNPLLAKAEKLVEPMITNPAVVFGILMAILAFIFWSTTSPYFKWLYKVVPMLLLCYFLPSLLPFFNVVDHSDTTLYSVAKLYLLPATLVLLTMSIDLKAIIGLGPKALIMFLTGSVGVVLGGPLAILLVSSMGPSYIEAVDGEKYDAKWRGYSTVAGSWIGGGANQLAMKETFLPIDDMDEETAERADAMYSVMIAVDIIVAEIWMVFLLLGVGHAKTIDRWFRADASSIETLKNKMENFSLKNARIPTTVDLMVILGIGFGAIAIAHFAAEYIGAFFTSEYLASAVELGGRNGVEWAQTLSLNSSFFWIIVLSTLIGLCLSFTPLKTYEGAGASKLGTVMIYILVAVIGLRMDISAVTEHPKYFLVGGIWMAFHVGLLLVVGFLIKAPYFFLAVGSKANIGGAASAPVVAGAFHPSLAPVGVLLAVLGYGLGTFGAYLCAIMMQMVAPV